MPVQYGQGVNANINDAGNRYGYNIPGFGKKQKRKKNGKKEFWKNGRNGVHN
jgi:hypothetical protein